MTLKVGQDGYFGETAGSGEEGLRGRALVVADLQEQEAAGLEKAAGVGGDPSQEVQAVRAAVEGLPRLKVADGRVEPADFGLGDVRRVGDQVVGRRSTGGDGGEKVA